MATQETFILAGALMDTFQTRLNQTCPNLGNDKEISRRQANLEVQHVLGAMAFAAAEHRTTDTTVTELPAALYSYDPSSEVMAHAS